MAKKMRVLRDGCGNPVKVVRTEPKTIRCGMEFTTDYGLHFTIANYDDTSGMWLCEIPGQNFYRWFDQRSIEKYLRWR